MRIAHLILAHTDLPHVRRLAERLLPISDVFIHIDRDTDDSALRAALTGRDGCYFITERLHCDWGGINAMEAEIALLRLALQTGPYDRLTFLQGADYPLKPDSALVQFYESHQGIEFCRACCATDAEDPYFQGMCRTILFFNHRTLPKKLWNRFALASRMKLRDGYVHSGGRKYPVYRGSAQWSITGDCARYIVGFHDANPEFNRWFRYAFPVDELYFSTVIHNSPFGERTLFGGAEPPKTELVNWRNLHWFEYQNGRIRVYTAEDAAYLQSRDALYVRKVNTAASGALLDLLDSL